MEVSTVHGRYEGKRGMDSRAFCAQVVRDPADVLHDGCRILEYAAIYALQYETGLFSPQGSIDDESVVDVSAAKTFCRVKPGTRFELQGNVPQISDRSLPHSTMATGNYRRRVIA